MSYGQQNRLNDRNSLAWFVYTGDHPIASKWALHTEYQWRRANWIHEPQQHLARLGLVRTLTDRVKLSGGYTYFQSHRYGNYPEVVKRPEPEHRIYEDITLTDQLGSLGLEHRLRLEQRWLGTRDETGEEPVQEWMYQNRIRYQLTLEIPLQGPKIDDGEWYLNAFDEVFIGFGRNVNNNVFNQNRLSGGLGYQFTNDAKLELNYLYQIRQHADPDPVSSQPVVELNHGFRLNIVYNLALGKTSKD
ncbi:hypothetical protein GCM10028805_42030 [Spirosoma harenae]